MLPHGQPQQISKGAAGQFFNQENLKAHVSQKVLVIDDVDRQVWELVSNVPHVSKPVAAI